MLSDPVLIDSSMQCVGCNWNHDGSILAIAGSMSVHSGGTSEKDSNVVQFYNPFGDHLRTLKIPGKQMSACAWEGESLRIALAVDSFIYFANIRPDYKWTYFANTVVYTYTRVDKTELAIVFWNIKTQEKHVRHVKKLLGISSSKDFCIIASNADEENQNVLSICNALGTTVEYSSR